jgi:hypothetical protein
VQSAALGAPPVLGRAQESVKRHKGGLRASRKATKVWRDDKIPNQTSIGLIRAMGTEQMTANRKRNVAAIGTYRQPTFSAQPNV